MNYAIELYVDIVDELDELMDEFLSEIDIGNILKPCVNHDQLIVMEDMGFLQLITARDNGELVGFHVSSTADDIFYKSVKTSCVLMYFLKPEYRGKGDGIKMFRYVESIFNENGVERIFMSRRIHIDNENLFKNLNYNCIEQNYEKYIQ